MQATVQERKSEALPPQPNQPSSGWQKIALQPEEGWTTFIFLGFVIYSAVWSIQVVNWVIGLNILTWTTALGLLLGFVAAKQSRLQPLLLHALTMVVGIFFAFWMTAVAYHASLVALWTHFTTWLAKVFTPNAATDDDVMFLLFLAVLSFILAYVSVWLVSRTRRPWLVILATSIVLLINLSYAPDGNLIYLTIFLLAGLLLLVRFNLSESFRQWKRRSLRYTADLGWDFMVAGMVFSVFLLVFGWILPEAGPNQSLSDVWNAMSNPWVSAQQLWTRLFQVTGGPGSGAYFSNQLQLTGSVDLPNEVILTYQTNAEGPYLAAVTQDYFDGHIWSSTGNTNRTFDTRQNLPVNKSSYAQVSQSIHLVNPPGGSPNQFIFAMADPLSFSVPVGITQDGSGPTSWYGRDPLVGGENYSVTSAVSTADENALSQVPLPQDAPGSAFSYPADLLARYTQVPNDLQSDQQIQDLARQWTDGQTTMYGMAQAIETHLRSGYAYSLHNDNPPSNEDAVAWFLTQSKKGFCTFFASSMVMLARLLGMPARVASGYTAGTYDNNGHYVVRGTDAHTWAQIYFAQYGWINFEPSAGFASVSRPLPSVTPSVTATTGTGNTPGVTPTKPGRGFDVNPGDSGSNSLQSQQNDLQVRLLLGAGGTLAVLVLLFGATSLWWRRLFRGLSPVAQTFGRVTLLAGWAGMKPRRAQTPYEYIGELEERLPVQAGSLHRLGELYVEERWGAPHRSEGALAELRQLWARLRGTLVRAVLRRPSLNPLYWLGRLRRRRG
ncbi:MAG TPA: transglutaminaseTgpA domain-containing protein [Ktedonobacterales bacterium]|nr:transglutaminaseTgpA domain-containing protein [Ktedonobacterales bacterium]